MMSIVYANQRFSRVLIDFFVHSGVKTLCYSPGSRSTPLILAIADTPELSLTCHIDERAMAFHALGHAKATLEPVVIVTTSGTAVANLLPAIVEASQSKLPLIVVTADRPEELINVGANQAIDQRGIFSPFLRQELQLPCPEDGDFAALLPQLIDVYQSAVSKTPGPVHINCPFREPFFDPSYTAPPSPQSLTESSFLTEPFSMTEEELSFLRERLRHDKGVLILGEISPLYKERVSAFLRDLAWPVFPDVLSQFRGDSGECFLSCYDFLLQSTGFEELPKPEVILQIGGKLSSQTLLSQLENWSVTEYFQILPYHACEDPLQLIQRCFYSRDYRCLDTLREGLGDNRAQGILKNFQRLNSRVQSFCDDFMTMLKPDSELKMIWALSSCIPSSQLLFLSNSLPIRLFNFIASLDFSNKVFSNRGASGIDGIISTATGIAKAYASPMTILIGDLATVHDFNSFQFLRYSPYPIILIIVNNNGGDIFSSLAISAQAEVFDRFFKTPQDLSFKAYADLADCSYDLIADSERLVRRYKELIDIGKSAIIELNVRDAIVDKDRLIKEALTVDFF